MSRVNIQHTAALIAPDDVYSGVSSANAKLRITMAAPGATRRLNVMRMRAGYLDANGVGLARLFVPRYSSGTTQLTLSGVNITIADANPDTITRASGSFVTDGWEVGDVVVLAGSAQAANNATPRVIATVAALTLTLEADETLTAVGAAAGVTLSCYRRAFQRVVLGQGWSEDLSDLPRQLGKNEAAYLILDAGGGTAVGYAEAEAPTSEHPDL